MKVVTHRKITILASHLLTMFGAGGCLDLTKSFTAIEDTYLFLVFHLMIPAAKSQIASRPSK